MTEIAFIGLGRMGLPMASRLLEAGHRVAGCDSSEAARSSFSARGGEAHPSPAEAARGKDILITMLPDGAIVREVLLGEAGAAAALAPGALVIDMSSSQPQGTQTLEKDLSELGLRLVDAPVSGGVKKAVDGSLAIMVGGEEKDVERARPLLSPMGSKIIGAGRVGAGHAMKALNNYVSAAGLVALCEALVVGGRFGIEPEVIVDILNASTGRNNSTENKAKPYMLSGSFNSGFALSLMSKDIGIAAGLSEGLGLETPLLSLNRALWAEALSGLEEGADHTEYLKFVEDSNEG